MNILIHHWDMDGIASAVILTKRLNKIFTYFTPSVGNYFLSKKEREIISSMSPEKIYLVDMSLPKDDLIFLNNLANFEVFDHHSGNLIEGVKINNPIIQGAKSIEYPSCTTVLREHFRLKEDILFWSGIWGDFGFKLKEGDKLLKELNEFLQRKNINFNDFTRFVEIADSQYKTGDKDKIYKVIDFLLSNSPLDILNIEEFYSIIDKLEEVKKEELKRVENFEKINFLKLNTPFYVISDICRLQYKKSPDKYNIVLGERKEFYNFYMRTGIEDLSDLVKETKEQGFMGGGKKDVIGVVMYKDDFKKFTNFLSNYFFKKRGIDIKKILLKKNNG